MEPDFFPSNFLAISFGPFLMKCKHNVKGNKYFQIMSKTEKRQKWRGFLLTAAKKAKKKKKTDFIESGLVTVG